MRLDPFTRSRELREITRVSNAMVYRWIADNSAGQLHEVLRLQGNR
jgi:hypothetical protein